MAKFCSKCGKEVGERQFCSNCGTKVANAPAPSVTPARNTGNATNIGMNYLLTMAAPVVCTILLLLKWITLEIPYLGDVSVNCFNFLFKISSITKGADGLTVIVFVVALVVFVLACVIAVYTIRTVKAAFEKNDYAPSYCGVACKVSVALSVIMIAIMMIFKSLLESEMGTFGSMAGELIDLTAVPYIMLVVSILGIFIAKNVDKQLEEEYNVRS